MMLKHFHRGLNLFNQNSFVHVKRTNSLITITKYHTGQQNQKFSRLINFDANYFDQVPFWLQPMDPAMVAVKNVIVQTNNFVGLPWWAVLIASSIVIRLTIFPLILVQMRRMSKFGPISPIFVLMKDTWKHSDMSKWQKIKTVLKMYRMVTKRQGLRFSTVMVYNMAYYPILISMIFAIRKLLSLPEIANSSFLHLNNLGDIDPYYILPTLTIGLYYYNFERFITPENKDTLLSKIRIMCQYFLILWYPFLCCWPSGIVIYMCTNAFMSVIQSNLMKKPWFLNKIAPEVVEYNYMLGTIEYDKGKSDTLIESIKLGEQDFKSKAILEDEIVRQTEKMITQLNKDSSKTLDCKVSSFGVGKYQIPLVQEIKQNAQQQKNQKKQKEVELNKEEKIEIIHHKGGNSQKKKKSKR